MSLLLLQNTFGSSIKCAHSLSLLLRADYHPYCRIAIVLRNITGSNASCSFGLQGPGLEKTFRSFPLPAHSPWAVTCLFSTANDLPGHVELKAHLTPPVVLVLPLCVNKDIQPGWCSRYTCCHTGPWVVVEQLLFLHTFRPRSHSPPNVLSLITISTAWPTLDWCVRGVI